MTRAVFEKYEDFLEFYKSLNEASSSGAENSIVLASASTSNSNITDNLAKIMGIEKDKSYTFTINLLDLLYNIASNNKFDLKKIGEGSKVDPGFDVLSIGDKKIEEEGSFYISKKEAETPLQITASNNGLLCLLRMGKALKEMITGSKISFRSSGGPGGIVSAKNWLVKFSLGGNVKESDSRGYDFWYAYPGPLAETANSFSLATSIAMLNFSGNEKLISKKGSNKDNSEYDPQVNSVYDIAVKDTDSISKSLNKLLGVTVSNLSKAHMLVNKDPNLNTTSAEDLVKNAKSYLSDGKTTNLWKDTNTPSKMLNNKGVEVMRKVITDLAFAISTSNPPDGWGKESDSIMNEYKSMIEQGLSQTHVSSWFDASQRINNWGDSKNLTGASGKGEKRQGEGEF